MNIGLAPQSHSWFPGLTTELRLGENSCIPMRAKTAACLDQTAPGLPVGVGHGVLGKGGDGSVDPGWGQGKPCGDTPRE